MTTKPIQTAGSAVATAIENLDSSGKAALIEHLVALIGEVATGLTGQELIDAAPAHEDHEVLAGTLRDVNLPHTLTVAGGNLTINGDALPSTRAMVSISGATTVLPPVNLREHVLYETVFLQGGAHAVTFPAHNATSAGVKFKRLNTFPDFPTAAGGRFVLLLRLVEVSEATFEIHANCGGSCAD